MATLPARYYFGSEFLHRIGLVPFTSMDDIESSPVSLDLLDRLTKSCGVDFHMDM